MAAGISIFLTTLIVLGLVAAGNDTRPYLKAAAGRFVSFWSALLANQNDHKAQHHPERRGTEPIHNFDGSVSQRNAAIVAATLGARITNIALKPVDILTAAAYDDFGVEKTIKNVRNLGESEVVQEMDAALDGVSGYYRERFKSDSFAVELTCGAFTKEGYFRPLSLAEISLAPIVEIEHQISGVLYKNAVDHALYDLGLSLDTENALFRENVARQWERQVYRAFNSSHPMEVPGIVQIAVGFPICFLFVGYWQTASRLSSLMPLAASQFQANDLRKGVTTLATLATGLYVTLMIRQSMSQEAQDDRALVSARKQFMKELGALLPAHRQQLEPMIRKAFLDLKASPDAGTRLWEALTKIVESEGAAINATVGWAMGQADLEAVVDELLRVLGLGLGSLALPIGTPADLALRVWNGSLTPGLDPPITEKEFVANVQRME